jgi:hypothetical protein
LEFRWLHVRVAEFTACFEIDAIHEFRSNGGDAWHGSASVGGSVATNTLSRRHMVFVFADVMFRVTESSVEHFGNFPQRYLATVLDVRTAQFLKFACSPDVSAKSGARTKRTNTTNNATKIGGVESC